MKEKEYQTKEQINNRIEEIGRKINTGDYLNNYERRRLFAERARLYMKLNQVRK